MDLGRPIDIGSTTPGNNTVFLREKNRDRFRDIYIFKLSVITVGDDRNYIAVSIKNIRKHYIMSRFPVFLFHRILNSYNML